MFDDCVGGPGFDGLGVAEVAVGCGEGSHSGGSACGDVPDVVANVDAAGWFDACYFAGVEKRVGEGFGAARGVAPNYAGAAVGKAAGMGTVAAAYGYLGSAEPIDAWQADVIIQHPLEILTLLGNR